MRNENAMRSAGSCLLHSGNQLLRVASRPQTQTTRIAKENRWMQIFFKENALMAFNSKPNDDVLLAWHATLSPILFFLHVSLGLNVYREQLLMFRLSYRWNTGPQRRKGSTGPAHKFNPRWRPKRPKWSSDMPRHALTCPTCSLYNSLGSLVDYSRSFEAIPSAPHVLHTCSTRASIRSRAAPKKLICSKPFSWQAIKPMLFFSVLPCKAAHNDVPNSDIVVPI